MINDVEQFKKLNPLIHFIKVKESIREPNFELIKKNFIPDCDSPSLPKYIVEGTRIYPLSVKSFPKVLHGMTAMEAGIWAVNRCKKEKWELSYSNIRACLNNLEMDY